MLVVVFFSFFIMIEGRGRSGREGLKPQGQGQNQRQRARNNKANVKVVAKKNPTSAKLKPCDSARTQVTVKLPPTFGGC